MFSKITKVLILSGCLVAAGAASANDRDVIVPVIAGAAVGAILATVISGSSHDNYRPQYQGYQPQPRYQPQYQPQYQPVAYVPVATRVEYRRFDPRPPRGYYNGGYDHGRDRDGGRDRDRGFDHNRGDGRW